MKTGSAEVQAGAASATASRELSGSFVERADRA
jgi:hypothetical protein